ncbi:MAG: FecR domain-containing protein [Kiritimatiellae bacterium]|nr:FecR domain-containing protein [Kiritimatiellia bacterium]
MQALFVDGLLRELARGGEGHDERFVAAVMEDARGAGGPAVTRRRVTGKGTTTLRPSHRSRAIEMRPRGLIGPSWWPTAIAAALVVGLAVLVSRQFGLIGPRLSDSGIVASRLGGRVDWVRNGRARPLAGDVRVGPGDRLATAGGDGAARVRYADGTTLDLGAATGVRLTEGRTKAFIENGRVVASVARRPANAPFILETPHAAVEVLGTLFIVEVDAGATRIEMQRGSVHITNKATRETVDLAAGYRAGVGKQTVVAAVPPFAPSGASPGGRVTDDLCVLYTFREAGGPYIRDVSGVGKPLNLRIRAGDVRRLPGGGVEIVTKSLIVSDGPATKIIAACKRSHELSAEVWITPANTVQGMVNQDWIARLMTVSRDEAERNFTLGQWGEDYRGRTRTTTTTLNGIPEVSSERGCVATRLTHLVYTREKGGVSRLYVDGVDRTAGIFLYKGTVELTPGTPVIVSGTLSNWNEIYPLALCCEPARTLDGESIVRAWLGKMYLGAVYSRALAPEEVRQNYRAGHGAASSVRAGR